MQRYFLYGTLMLLCLLPFLFAANGEAAGKITPEDFSYQNIALGDSEEDLRSKWGTPDAENLQARNGGSPMFRTSR